MDVIKKKNHCILCISKHKTGNKINFDIRKP